MNIERITNFEDFLALEPVWNRLLEQSSSEHICLTFEWIKSWWLAFGRSKQLFILLFRNSGQEIVGIAPLMKTRSIYLGLPVRKIAFIYDDNSSRMDFIISENKEIFLERIIAYLAKNRHQWDIVELQNIAEESPNYPVLAAELKYKNRLFLIKRGLVSPFIRIETSWEEFLSRRSKNFRRKIKNVTRQINDLGNYNVEKVDSPNDNNQALNKIFAISSKSWKAKYKRNITHSPENKYFFEILSQNMGERNQLNIWLLNFNGAAIAYKYTLCYRNKTYALRSDFNEAYRHLAPGFLLNYQAIKHYFDNNFKEYDLCGNDEGYKKRLTSLIRQHYCVIIYSGACYTRLLYALDANLICPLRCFLKKFPLARKIKKALLFLIYHRYTKKYE